MDYPQKKDTTFCTGQNGVFEKGTESNLSQ